MRFKKQSTLFQEIKGDLKTGDIVLMHGIHLSSRLIEKIEDCPWSHAAIIIKGSDIGLDVGENDLLLWESDTETPVDDVILKKPKPGPMLVKFEERLKYNFTHGEDSKCAIRHLYTERTKSMFEVFMQKTLKQAHEKNFPDHIHEFTNPLRGRILKQDTGLDTFFCSELVAFTYKNWGLLTSSHPMNSYAPGDFSETLSMGLLKRAWLGNEIELEINTDKL